VAPPHGLSLVAVGYPTDPVEYAQRAALTRRLRLTPEAAAADELA
jgi:tRNA pseudouridine38-40 synthase